MSSFVLVHGSWHGAWCWHKIVPRLERAGHRVVALDLPGHGRDRRDPGELTLAHYTDAIVGALDALPEPAILVGHSRGGLAITQAAETRPDAVSVLVYLAAFLVPDGGTVLDLARGDRDSLVPPNLVVNPERGWDMLREEAFVDTLYADCSPEDVALCRSLLAPEPIAPSRTAVSTTPGRFGRVPRVYVELLRDRAVSLPLQRRMQARLPCREVLSVDASHSAYFSRPDELAACLLSLPEVAADRRAHG
jgi:pimeloyl-ACP methyl ester carboxylesterase